MITYKLRAECHSDARRFVSACREMAIEFQIVSLAGEEGFPDEELAFESSASLEELRLTAEAIVDGHGMAETLAPLAQYTGERRS